jgi:hypothetical protein
MTLEGLAPEEISALALAGRQMRDNPATRGLYLRMLKAANPGVPIPEVDVEVRTARALAARDQQIKEMQDRENVRMQRDHAITLYENLREDGVVSTRQNFAELVKYAHENGFTTTEQGLRKANAFQAQERSSAEPTPLTARPLVPKDNKDLLRNPREWARKEASAAISEIMKSRAQTPA